MIIFSEKNGEKHFIQILHESQIALLHEIYGYKKVKVVKCNSGEWSYDFYIYINLEEIPKKLIHIIQVRWHMFVYSIDLSDFF